MSILLLYELVGESGGEPGGVVGVKRELIGEPGGELVGEPNGVLGIKYDLVASLVGLAKTLNILRVRLFKTFHDSKP